MEHPLDLFDAGLGEMVQDPARAEVEEQAALAVFEQVDVAGVWEPVQAGEQSLEWHGVTSWNPTPQPIECPGGGV